MKKIKKAWSRMKIKYKLSLAMYLILLPIVLSVSGFIYLRDYQTAVDDMRIMYQNLADVMDENVNYMQMDILDLTTYISVNSDILSHLIMDRTVMQENPLAWEKTPMNFVRDILSVKSHIRTLALYPGNGAQPFYISVDRSVHNLDIEQIKQTETYHRALEAMGKIVLTREAAGVGDYYIMNASDKIVISRILFDLSKKNVLGYLTIGIDVKKYEQIFNSVLQRDDEGAVLLGESGQLLVTAGAVDERILSFLSQGGLNGNGTGFLEYEEHYLIFRKSSEIGNIVCYVAPQENWSSMLWRVSSLSLILGAALLLGLLPISFIVSSLVSRPLYKLYNAMLHFQKGDFEQQVPVAREDEIGELIKTFNQMVLEIKELIDKNYLLALHEQQSELDALQSQINPHFLYNALDSLYWQAYNAESFELAEDIYAMAQLFRLVLQKGQKEVSISNEIELISHYLHIQKMRFGKKLDYRIHIDEEIEEETIPKLILQPFVENAIVHGFELTERMGLIEISGGRQGAELVFTVADNGVGMSKEQLDRILMGEEGVVYASQRIGGYAIHNVWRRLRLMYGDGFTLNIESEMGKGTTAIIKLPIGSTRGSALNIK